MNCYKTFLIWTGALLLAVLAYSAAYANGQDLYRQGVALFSWQTAGGGRNTKAVNQELEKRNKELAEKDKQIETLRAQLANKDSEVTSLRKAMNRLSQFMKDMQAQVERMAQQFQSQLEEAKKAQKASASKPETNPIIPTLLQQIQANAAERETLKKQISEVQEKIYALSDRGELGTLSQIKGNPSDKDKGWWATKSGLTTPVRSAEPTAHSHRNN